MSECVYGVYVYMRSMPVCTAKHTVWVFVVRMFVDGIVLYALDTCMNVRFVYQHYLYECDCVLL